jgi:hypothetical protein
MTNPTLPGVLEISLSIPVGLNFDDMAPVDLGKVLIPQLDEIVGCIWHFFQGDAFRPTSLCDCGTSRSI